MLNLQVKNTLLKAGINADDYSGHSFRCGGASFTMKSGVPFRLIKCQGDWEVMPMNGISKQCYTIA